MGELASGDLGLDDLDAALNNLEVKLKGSAPSDMLVRRGLGLGIRSGSGSERDPRLPLTYLLSQDSLTTIPELKDHLRIFRLSVGPA